MKRREVIVIVLVFAVLILASFFIWRSLDEKIYHSPGEIFPPLETIDTDSAFCFDSDLGLDYFVKGGVLWGVGDGASHVSEDYCVSVATDIWPEGTLFEMHCDLNSFSIKDMACPNGCEEGICV